MLQDCHISGQGASKLAAAFWKNSSLKDLDLDSNPIGVEGASSMSHMLQHNTLLEELSRGDNSVGEEGIHQLINSLKHNETLTTLWLPSQKPVTTESFGVGSFIMYLSVRCLLCYVTIPHVYHNTLSEQ